MVVELEEIKNNCFKYLDMNVIINEEKMEMVMCYYNKNVEEIKKNGC